ncbi:hypothetical protein IU500_06650 [Nocardia terpenica]|uniref:hypothetical protein n=1 Tax=Nocardia terpenica TaxID=455432 RepID=UPI001893D77A|nr:hypothetical protein [Nocardia terpenica]MBF6060458.1 hypothetical protein [Nocardia terpenica]MBF6103718.1 hypothetical protein [Nocardia terpenica]MBF6111908.1 hypothetical protein [Nocardia terpenica]MBF6117939.1 hypothetical protein [Nocardia terpenica]MBF6155335.1 hypothetical protein [Nocardia terpenica]
MSDRLRRVLETVQSKYLVDTGMLGREASDELIRQLRRKQERIAGEIWDRTVGEGFNGTLPGEKAVRAALDAYAAAEDTVIEREIIGRIPTRALHEVRNAWAYREAQFVQPLDFATVDTGRSSTRFWQERAAESHVGVEFVGDPAEHCGNDTIEDLALPPMLPWTDADKKVAMERALEIASLEPGQWIELDWPPTGSLYSPGIRTRPSSRPALLIVTPTTNQATKLCSRTAATAVRLRRWWRRWRSGISLLPSKSTRSPSTPTAMSTTAGTRRFAVSKWE